MAILVNDQTRVAVYGVSSRYATAQVREMQAMGTRIVAGVSVGSGGATVAGVPVFDTMSDAVAATDANAAVVYIPAAGTQDAIMACVDAGVKTIMAAAEFVPLHDTMHAARHAREHGAWLVGPNTVGISSPGKCTLGSIPASFTLPGSVGLLTRSGTLNINVARLLSREGVGQSTCVHAGGDYICGRNPLEYLQAFEADADTRVIAYCGEIGGTKEYDMIAGLSSISKPVVAMIVGQASPREKRLGHAGALVSSDRDTAQAKMSALREAGVLVAGSLPEFIALICKTATAREPARLRA